MSDELERLREELDRTRRVCDDLRADNLRKEDTIRKLTAELKASFRGYIYDAVVEEGGAKIYRREIDTELLKRRRADALERHRIEYENRVGTANGINSSRTDEGYDELDTSKPERG